MAAKVPGPDDTVQVRYGDLMDLDRDTGELRATIDEMRTDIAEILVALQIAPAHDMTGHEVVKLVIIPKIVALMSVKGQVDAAENELRRRADSLKLPTVDLGGGRSAIQLGRRIPDHLLPKGFTKPRRRRRG